MTDLPENDASEPATSFGVNPNGLSTAQESGVVPDQSKEQFNDGAIKNRTIGQASAPVFSGADPDSLVPASLFTSAPPAYPQFAQSSPDQPLFQSWTQPPVRRPVRIPHFGHLLLLALLLAIAFAFTIAAIGLAMHFHLFGWQLSTKYATDLRLNLLSEVSLYLITFGMSLFVFPMIWHEGYFKGLQWRGSVALSRWWLLAGAASVCFGLALLDQVLLPGPDNAPIEKMISTPGSAWLMFAFGVTMAPFFEEMFFRGFLLPALCTAWDWVIEQSIGKPVPPLDANSHPQWSMPAMVIGSVLTSIPFALLHVEQQGHSLGPFLLLIVISLILCAVRLRNRSLAASTMVHAMYNFLIFALTMIGTGGFRHFDKM